MYQNGPSRLVFYLRLRLLYWPLNHLKDVTILLKPQTIPSILTFSRIPSPPMPSTIPRIFPSVMTILRSLCLNISLTKFRNPGHNLPPDLPLLEAEVFVLSKSLKFVPLKPSVNMYDVIHDCQRCFSPRSLRWMAVLGHLPKRQPKPDDIFTELFQSTGPENNIAQPKIGKWLSSPSHFSSSFTV